LADRDDLRSFLKIDDTLAERIVDAKKKANAHNDNSWRLLGANDREQVEQAFRRIDHRELCAFLGRKSRDPGFHKNAEKFGFSEAFCRP
jgi:hypothetical protein